MANETLFNEAEVTGRKVLDSKPTQALVARTPLDLLQIALSNNAGIDVIERLSALQERAQAKNAEMEFNDALTACQQEVRTVINDSDKTAPGGKKWATYRALDKAIRGIYLGHEFSISFGSADCSIPDSILVTCHVSHKSGHTRLYQLPMDASGKGPQGAGALSKPHAILAAMEYGRRCLLKSIFNLVTGDEEELQVTNGELEEQVEFIQNAKDPEELKRLYAVAYDLFEATPAALKVLIAARKARKKEQGW